MAYAKVAQRKRFALLRDAYNELIKIPEVSIDLDSVCVRNKGGTPTCGSIACGIGWIGLMPKFQKFGIKTTNRDSIQWNGRSVDYPVAVVNLFGITESEAYELFSSSFGSRYATGNTHKEILLNRIMKFLDRHGEVDDPKYF